MKLKRWVAFGTLLVPALGVQAGQHTPTADPADPAAPVPAIVHASALSAAPAGADQEATPDRRWHAANATVAGHSAHSAHSGHSANPSQDRDAAHGAHAAHGGAQGAQAAQPAAPPAPTQHQHRHPEGKR